jgi:hypothetical protein
LPNFPFRLRWRRALDDRDGVPEAGGREAALAIGSRREVIVG